MPGLISSTHISRIRNWSMEKDKKPTKKKQHGNEKPLKIKGTFDKVMKKIVKAKPPTGK